MDKALNLPCGHHNFCRNLDRENLEGRALTICPLCREQDIFCHDEGETCHEPRKREFHHSLPLG